jgi:hypothetical protein
MRGFSSPPPRRSASGALRAVASTRLDPLPGRGAAESSIRSSSEASDAPLHGVGSVECFVGSASGKKLRRAGSVTASRTWR